jgi:hypothetical protein
MSTISELRVLSRELQFCQFRSDVTLKNGLKSCATGIWEDPADAISLMDPSQRPFVAGQGSGSWLEAASTPVRQSGIIANSSTFDNRKVNPTPPPSLPPKSQLHVEIWQFPENERKHI